MILNRKMYDKLLTLKSELNGKKPFLSRVQDVSASQRYAKNSARKNIKAMYVDKTLISPQQKKY